MDHGCDHRGATHRGPNPRSDAHPDAPPSWEVDRVMSDVVGEVEGAIQLGEGAITASFTGDMRWPGSYGPDIDFEAILQPSL